VRARKPRRGAQGEQPEAIYSRIARRRDRRLFAIVVVALLVLIFLLAGWLLLRDDGGSQTPSPRTSDGRVRVLIEEGVAAQKSADGLSVEALATQLPRKRRDRRGAAIVSLQTDRAELRRRLRRAAAAGGGTVRLPERAVASKASLPAVKQAFRNGCEAASLTMLLAASRVKVDQQTLQAELPRSGPLDPEETPNGETVWGDPTKGFVGRAEGGGAAGGYGVYEPPIRQLAARHGVELISLSGRSPQRIYAGLLAGHQIMVWVGLTNGPFQTWRSPEGKKIEANFGEHAVVLTGIRKDAITVNDPLRGQRTTWTRARFEEQWERLGRRALSN